ncbi:hypothetical protein J4457_06200 [Candidatus Woesearchaeota archaeon]|nr:hypothetical protein [Candidatus Woesearchaeota archaeon]
MLSDRNSGIILLIALILMFVRIPFVLFDGNYIAALMEKAKMGKPVDEKTGHAKIRAKEFVCPECGYTEEKEEYESKLVANIKYTCPKCKKDGEIQIPYKRKKVDGVDALVFNCKACNEKILITKKMKDPKAKGSSVEDDE